MRACNILAQMVSNRGELGTYGGRKAGKRRFRLATRLAGNQNGKQAGWQAE